MFIKPNTLSQTASNFGSGIFIVLTTVWLLSSSDRPECSLVCLFRASSLEKCLEQVLHLCFFSPLCLRVWRAKCSFRLKVCGQNWQLFNFADIISVTPHDCGVSSYTKVFVILRIAAIFPDRDINSPMHSIVTLQ